MNPTKHDSIKNDYQIMRKNTHKFAKQALKKLGELVVEDMIPGPFHKTKRLVLVKTWMNGSQKREQCQ